jgi:UDP-3-O-[3-hydroxymyristoyl] glucosamine N-acyltransferase LpxD
MRKFEIEVSAANCAKFLGAKLIGGEINVCAVAGVSERVSGAIKFANSYNESLVVQLNESLSCFVIAHPDFSGKLDVPHVLSKSPRLDFCRLANHLFKISYKPVIESSAVIGDNVTLGENIYIGHNVVIEDDVEIGSDTVILHNVVISAKSVIGRGCLIKSGCVIGQRGFGFERDEIGVPISFPHFGSVIIGNYVEIGALNTLVAGALSNTVIEDHVKTDDHVHIAHNVEIGQKTLIAACAEISGSAVIGEQVWLGPNCSVIDGIKIDDKALVGIGSVVRKCVEKSSVVAGNPSKVLRRLT